MSFLGIDIGTTKCKVIHFSSSGEIMNASHVEYKIDRRSPGYAELDAPRIWEKIAAAIQRTTGGAGSEKPSVVSVTSMGEAMVPVTREREILGPSLLNIDKRGNEYVKQLREAVPDRELYQLNGNSWGDQYGVTKLMWIKEHQPDLYDRADYFLHWGSFIPFMLGAEAVVDYSLANRSLLFDISSCRWSERLLKVSGIDREKLPAAAASGTPIGSVSRSAAELTGLPQGTSIVAGAHDQCASAVGAGVLKEGEAFYGLGTFPCITPVYRSWDADAMIELGLNVEHHVVPGLYASFIYHMGGEIIKWYRELFSDDDFMRISETMSSEPSRLLLMPYMTPMGPPDFISDQSGIFMGLNVNTSREQLLKAIIEANAFALALVCKELPRAGIPIHTLRTAGGGSRYSSTLQINSDILGIPLIKPNVTEAGALGAGMIGAVGVGIYNTLEEAVTELVRTDMIYEPDSGRSGTYRRYYSYFAEAKELFSDFNRRMTKEIAHGMMPGHD